MSPEWTPHILHNRQMVDIHQNAKAHESLSIRFWNVLLNQDFVHSQNWAVAPEQLVYRDTRSGMKRVDTTIENWNDARGTYEISVIHEAKRENHSAKDIERQACNYAKAIITERTLSELYIITTIGTTFRTWRMDPLEKVLNPLFGGKGETSKEYLPTDQPNGDYEYQAFIARVKNAAASPQAPTLFSTGGLDQAASSSSSDEAMDTAGSSKGAASGPAAGYTYGTGKWRKGGRKMDFEWTTEEGEKKSCTTLAENWILDEGSGHMIWYSNTFRLTFACMRPW